MKEVIFTGPIAQCPHCEKPTTRLAGTSMATCVYYSPVYDKNGININPDRNTITTTYKCTECDKGYTIKGNNIDGFYYSDI